MVKKLFKGISSGAIGIDLVDIFDSNGDGKVTWSEVKKAPLDRWIKFAVSTGTSVLAVFALT